MCSGVCGSLLFVMRLPVNVLCIPLDRWVHHTSFLWDYNAELMEKYLRMPQKQPDYRLKRRHTEFCTSIKKLISEHGSGQGVHPAATHSHELSEEEHLDDFIKLFQYQFFQCMQEESNEADLNEISKLLAGEKELYFKSLIEDVGVSDGGGVFSMGADEARHVIDSFTGFIRRMDTRSVNLPRSIFL